MTPYYQDEAVTIYHGDCAALLPQLKATAIITDPPYGVGIKYGAGFDDQRSDYWGWLRERVEQMRAVTPLVVFTHRVKALAELTGWDWIAAWTKPMSFGSRIGNSPLRPHWEPIFLYGVMTLGTRSDPLPDVLNFSPERGPGVGSGRLGRERHAATGSQIAHPLPKPLGLYRRLILGLTKPGDVVLDPFMGSGTTLRAAKDLNRRAVGIEIEERYCELAARRMGQEVLAL